MLNKQVRSPTVFSLIATRILSRPTFCFSYPLCTIFMVVFTTPLQVLLFISHIICTTFVFTILHYIPALCHGSQFVGTPIPSNVLGLSSLQVGSCVIGSKPRNL